MRDWVFNPLADSYALSSDADNRWRPGGSVDEVCADAGLDPASIAASVVKFARDHEKRLARLQQMLGTV